MMSVAIAIVADRHWVPDRVQEDGAKCTTVGFVIRKSSGSASDFHRLERAKVGLHFRAPKIEEKMPAKSRRAFQYAAQQWR
jgi:hypothetical protein